MNEQVQEPGLDCWAEWLLRGRDAPLSNVGWPGAVIEEKHLATTIDNEVLRFEEQPNGRPTQVLVDIDGENFTKKWLEKY